MKIVNVPDNKPEHTADHKLHSIHSIVMNTMRMVEREKGKELASLKEVVKELIPIAEHATRSLIFKPHIHNQYDEVIDRAKRISDNK